MDEETRQKEITMVNFLIFILATWGATQILVNGRILNAIRPKNKFFHCGMCMSFWVGIVFFLIMWFFGASFVSNFWIGLITSPFIGSAISYLMIIIVDDDGIRSHRTLTLRGELKNVKPSKSSHKKVDES